MVIRRNRQKVVLVSKDLADAQFKCTECRKVFISALHVEKHLSRRHGIISQFFSEKGDSCGTRHEKIIEVASRIENLLERFEDKTLNDSLRLEKLDKSCATEMDVDHLTRINDSILSQQFEGRKSISVLTLQKSGGEQFNVCPINEDISQRVEGTREDNDKVESPFSAMGGANLEIVDKCGDSEKMEKISSYRDAIARLQPLLLTLIGKLDQAPDMPKFPDDQSVSQIKFKDPPPSAVSSVSVPNFLQGGMELPEPKENSESEITNDGEFDQGATSTESDEENEISEGCPSCSKLELRNMACAKEEKSYEDLKHLRATEDNRTISTIYGKKAPLPDTSMESKTSSDYEMVRRQISDALGACEDEVCENHSKERKLSLEDINKRMREILNSKREDGNVESSGETSPQVQGLKSSKENNLEQSRGVQLSPIPPANLSPISEECAQQNSESQGEKCKTSYQDQLDSRIHFQQPLKRQVPDETEIGVRQVPILNAEEVLFQQEISECQQLIGELANDLQKWRKTKRTKLNDKIRAQVEEKLSLNLALLGIDKEKWKLTDNEAAVANLVLNRKKLRSKKGTNSSLYDELRSAYAGEIDKMARSKLDYPI